MAEDAARNGGTLTEEPAAPDKPSPIPRTKEKAAEPAPHVDDAIEPDSDVDDQPDADIDGTTDEAEEETEPNRPRRFALFITAVTVLALVIAGTTTLAVLLGRSVLDANRVDADRQAAMSAAQQELINLLTISQGTVDADVARLLDGATGAFHQDFSNQKDTFLAIVKEQKVTSTGDIRSAGLESVNGDTARVLVAAKATVTNAQAPKGEERNYRLAVTLQRVEDRWLVSQMEFVP